MKIAPGKKFRLKSNLESLDKRILGTMTSDRIRKGYLGEIVTIDELNEPGFLTERGYTVYVKENPELWPIELLERI